MQYQKELQIAKRAAKEAGDYLMKKFNKPHQNKISYKKKQEIVTEADIGADKIIDKIIKSEFPKHQILSEELVRSKKKSDFLWIVDPLDGTNNFAHGVPIFAVCIALAEKNNLKVGVVYLPYFKEIAWAVEDGGAYLNGKKIKASAIAKLDKSFIVTCHGYAPEYKRTDCHLHPLIDKAAQTTRELGAAGYELVSTARGHVEGGYIIGTRPWDSAAGALILREAGGKATNFKGKEWKISDNNILYSNGKIHDELLKILGN